MIRSLKSMQFLTTVESIFSVSVVQRHENNHINQEWIIDYAGNGLYKIKSALKSKYYLVVKDRSVKECELLIISDI